MLVLVALVTARRGRRKGHGHPVGNLGCQYDKGQWGACDESTNEMKRTLTLKEVKDGCDATMEQTRPCKRKQNKQKKKCKYDKSDWGDCDTATNMVSRTLTLQKGEDGCKQTQIQTISCEKFLQMKKMKEEKKTAKEGMKAEKMLFKGMHRKLKDLHKLGCRFKEEVEPCNKETQKVKKTFTLESGDVTQCKMDPIEISCKIQEKIERKKQMKLEKKQKRKQKKKERKEHKRKNKKELKKQKKKNHKRNRNKGKKQGLQKKDF